MNYEKDALKIIGIFDSHSVDEHDMPWLARMVILNSPVVVLDKIEKFALHLVSKRQMEYNNGYVQDTLF